MAAPISEELTPQVPGVVLGWRKRAGLVLLALALGAVFTIACRLNPYHSDGTPRLRETHRQLGLPSCNFYRWTGKPCPACGMTTSFALLMHGDPVNSLRANAAGTLLAVACLAAIPWSLASAWRGRYYGIRSLELTVTLFLLVFVTVMLVRWGIVLWLG